MAKDATLWWTTLRYPDNHQPLPPNVIERGGWYSRHKDQSRRLSHGCDVTVLVVTAAVPVSIALGWWSWVPALLGSDPSADQQD